MANTRLIPLTMTFIGLLVPTEIMSSPPFILYNGATQLENQQLNFAFSAIAPADLPGREAALDNLLKGHPDNRPARFLLAESLVRRGAIRKGVALIESLEKNYPDFERMWVCRLRAEIARDLGDRNAEAAALQGVLRAEPGTLCFQARLAELRGDAARAEELWEKVRDDARDTPGAGVALSYAPYCIRQGDLAAAAVSLERTVGQLPKHDPDSAYMLAAARTELAAAYWAEGKRDEALRVALLVAQAGLDHALDSSRDSQGVKRDYEAFMLCHTLLARGAGTAEARRDAEHVLTNGSETLLDPSWSYQTVPDPVLTAVIQGRKRVRDAAKSVAEILKEAPYLDGALWSAMYLALLYPDECGDLGKLLPEKTLQRRIFNVESGT